jgi:hypothetical protein
MSADLAKVSPLRLPAAVDPDPTAPRELHMERIQCYSVYLGHSQCELRMLSPEGSVALDAYLMHYSIILNANFESSAICETWSLEAELFRLGRVQG